MIVANSAGLDLPGITTLRATPARRAAGRAAGFTLIELLVVLAIVGLATVATLPAATGGSPRLQARIAARDMVSALRATRAQALRANRPVTFDCDPAARRFALPDGQWRRLSPAVEVVPERAGTPVVFFPDGGSSGGRFVVRPGDIAIDVDWLTGAVHERF